jgi:hypothetical protein
MQISETKGRKSAIDTTVALSVMQGWHLTIYWRIRCGCSDD